jgi:hypothetical protein
VGVLDMIAGRVAGGETVESHPTGAPMVPLIRSRQRVTVAPTIPSKVEVGDIVLARVAGTIYLHLVSAIDAGRQRVQISNNRGRVPAGSFSRRSLVVKVTLRVDEVARRWLWWVLNRPSLMRRSQSPARRRVVSSAAGVLQPCLKDGGRPWMIHPTANTVSS